MEKKIMERKVSDYESGYYLSAWGNENIIKNYIAHFEKKMIAEINEVQELEYDISSANFPNFAAWIRFYTELICNSLHWRLFRFKGDWKKIQNLSFGKARDMIIERIERETELRADRIEKNELETMKDAINLVLNLRHSFQHGGLPNLMRDLWYKSNEEKLIRILRPKNYKETKEIFLKAEALIKLLPQPIIRFKSE
jgi:hypothetical protein